MRTPHTELAARIATAACASGLSVALLALWRAGRPPALRIDALWVHGRRPLVELMLIGVAAALLSAGVAMLIGRSRGVVTFLWAAAIALAVTQFPDRLAIICRILVERALQSAPG